MGPAIIIENPLCIGVISFLGVLDYEEMWRGGEVSHDSVSISNSLLLTGISGVCVTGFQTEEMQPQDKLRTFITFPISNESKLLMRESSVGPNEGGYTGSKGTAAF